MPRGQDTHIGIILPPPQLEATQELPANVRALLRLAQRMADRCVRGKYGLALENDARETLDLWETLPDEIRVLL